MKSIRFLALIGLISLQFACGGAYVKETMAEDGKTLQSVEYGGGDPDYALYAHTMARMSAPKPAVDTTACNGDATCVVAVAALADRGSGAGQPVLQPPRPKVSGLERAGNFALKALGITVPGAVNWHQADVSADTTRALYSMIGDMHQGTVALGSVPSYNAGGDIITGTRTETNVTDSYNDSSDHSTDASVDLSGDGSAVGDGNELVNGNNAGNSGNIGEGNRQDSDDNDDHSNDGDECTGQDCQGVEVPVDPDPGT